MSPKLLTAICGLGWLALVAFPGCSKPPVNWAQPLTGIDRLVVTNQAFAVGETFTGQEAFSVVEAVKSARRKTVGADLDWADPRVWQMSFMAGTNTQAVVPFCFGIIRLDGVEYQDSSGVLTSLWKKLESKRSP
jgi:hypothetical protein